MENVRYEDFKITRENWESRNGHKALVIWFTGLSGSGKTTLAKYIINHYFNSRKNIISLDGDNMRTGLCSNLSFTDEDRKENIRRVAETSKLFFNSGSIVCCSFISPSREERIATRKLFPEGKFLEVYVKCPIEVCESRDVKGLYKKARNGEIPNFTGISSKYDEPASPGVVLETDKKSVEECAAILISEINKRI